VQTFNAGMFVSKKVANVEISFGFSSSSFILRNFSFKKFGCGGEKKNAAISSYKLKRHLKFNGRESFHLPIL
jgi:hypothetical protein